VIDEECVHLIANRAHNTDKIKEFEELALKAEEIFKKDNIWNIKVEKVYVGVYKNPSLSGIIKKLHSGINLDEDEHCKIQNVFYNMFIGNTTIQFDETNMIHRGIVIGILLTSKHDMISPFYPLTMFPEQHKKVNKISNGLKADLKKIFAL